MKLVYHFVLVIFHLLNSIQFVLCSTSLDCLKAENCSSCIRVVNCAWCLDERFDPVAGGRCDYPQRLIKDGCSSNLIYNPKNSVETIEEIEQENRVSEEPLSGPADPKSYVKKRVTNRMSFKDEIDFFSSKNQMDRARTNRNQFKGSLKRNVIHQNDKLIQLKPDKIRLKVRENTKIRFNVTFDQAEKYPLDIYYLMDLTFSMKDHQEALVKQAEQISKSMEDITTKFRLGFGSFVDKVVMPYSNMLPAKLENPCSANIPCIKAYGYRNHLGLTNDSKLFLQKVKEARLSGNLDNAEGGFDALIQVISCKNEINWSYPSRKIILFATDSLFHYAGDGKLGGIVAPNDGQCHLNKEGYYTETLSQDYPSLSQINRAIVSNQINIIFSVPDSALKVYEILSENLQGSVTGRLAENSSNIVDLIRDNYKKIVSTIELKDDSSKNVEIKYFSRCTADGGPMRETNLCRDVGVGQKLQFEVELGVKSCKQFKSKGERFVIFPLGIEEKTEVELEMICDCECDAKAEAKAAPECSGNGNLKCGVCECDTSFFGEKCQCSQNNLTSIALLNDDCTVNNVTCSNKGTCTCGKCLCDDKTKDGLLIYGKHCECDDYSCPKDNNGLTCGGKGRCCDKKCDCAEGWSGESCECPLDESACLSPINGKICSGHGVCSCGHCQCQRKQAGEVPSEIWTGRFCNECPTCNEECALYDPCVLCHAFDSGPYKSACKENCKLDMKIVKQFSYSGSQPNRSSSGIDGVTVEEGSRPVRLESQANAQFEASLLKRCVMIDEENCRYEFVFAFQPLTERISIEILSDKVCPNVQSYLIFMSIIVLFIIVTGLLALVIWKAVVDYRDRKACKEWLQYLETRKFTSTGQNPLYKAPNSLYQNPLYESKIESN